MQFAENFHQSKPEPVQFARAVRLIMKEDESLTAAEVSRIVGAPVDWTRKSLKLLELPEGILARVERGDLSFTTADFVRRQVARGAVTEQKAQELVEAHADGGLSSTELKFGAGYVPPPPKDYEETSARLDAARREASKPAPREERDEDWTDTSPGPSEPAPPPLYDGLGDRRGRRVRARRVPAPLRDAAHEEAAADHGRGRRARVRALAASARAAARAAVLRARSDRRDLGPTCASWAHGDPGTSRTTTRSTGSPTPARAATAASSSTR